MSPAAKEVRLHENTASSAALLTMLFFVGRASLPARASISYGLSVEIPDGWSFRHEQVLDL